MRRNWFRSVGAALAVLTMMAAIGPALAQVIPNSATYPNGTKVDTQPTYTNNPNNGSPCLVGNTGCPVPGGGGGGGGTSATIVSGQAVIAVTGTAVQFQTASAALTNGLIFCAPSSNNSAGITVGGSGVTNTTTGGTGNGYVIPPGACGSLAISNANLLYFNGTAGDVLTYLGN